MYVIDELTNERNALRKEVAELKRKLAEVEVERDALRELNKKILEKLWTCRSAIYYEGGNVEELDKFLAEAKNINSSAK